MQSWTMLYLALVMMLALVGLALFMRSVLGSWKNVRCTLLYPGCDWRWQHNENHSERLYLAGHYIGKGRRVVGIYACSRCDRTSIGCARHEQSSRQIYRDEFDRSSA